MNIRMITVLLGIGLLFFAACSGNNPVDVEQVSEETVQLPQPSFIPVGIEINKEALIIQENENREFQLVVEMISSNGKETKRQTVTNEARYVTSDTTVVTVSDIGFVRIVGEANQSASITVSYGGFNREIPVAILSQGKKITFPIGITIEPNFIFTQELGIHRQLKTEFRWFNGENIERVNITRKAEYESDNKSVAAVSAEGLVDVMGFGIAYINVFYKGESEQIPVIAVEPNKEVELPTVKTRIIVEPSLITAHELGFREQLKVSLELLNLETENYEYVDITRNGALYSTSNGSVAVVSSTGLIEVVGFSQNPIEIKVMYERFNEKTLVFSTEPTKAKTFIKVFTEPSEADIWLIDPEDDLNGGSLGKSPTLLTEIQPGEYTIVAKLERYVSADTLVTAEEGDTLIVRMNLEKIPDPPQPDICVDVSIPRTVIRIDGTRRARLKDENGNPVKVVFERPLKKLVFENLYSETNENQSEEIMRGILVNVETGEEFVSEPIPDDRGGVKRKEVRFNEEVPAGTYYIDAAHEAYFDNNVTDAPSSIHIFGFTYCY